MWVEKLDRDRRNIGQFHETLSFFRYVAFRRADERRPSLLPPVYLVTGIVFGVGEIPRHGKWPRRRQSLVSLIVGVFESRKFKFIPTCFRSELTGQRIPKPPTVQLLDCRLVLSPNKDWYV